MAASSGDAHPWPIYNARFRLTLPILDADGDLVPGASSLDTELSQDSGTFADATNEATEIASSSGFYYIDLIATELDTLCTAGEIKTSTTGAKTTCFTLYPRRLPVIRTGTAQAGASSTITLDSSASAIDDYYVGCYVNITNNTPSNALGQARKITGYVGSTKVATVEAAWGTNPSSSSTFEVLATEEWSWRLADLRAYGGAAGTFSAGRPEVNMTNIAGSGVNANAAQLGVNVIQWNSVAVTDLYTADIQFTRDEANTQDEWTTTWFKNGVRLTSGITSPTLQLVKRADGTDLKAATSMTQVGSTGTYKLDLTSTDRVTVGEAVLAIVSATIDAGTRTFARLIGRDSS